MRRVVELHTDESIEVAGVTLDPEGRPILLLGMTGAVAQAYLHADLMALGVAGGGPTARPVEASRAVLPVIQHPPSKSAAASPKHSLSALYEAWKVVAVVKPATMVETDYAFKALTAFLGHEEAGQVTREALARWRDRIKAGGVTNNTKARGVIDKMQWPLAASRWAQHRPEHR